MGENLYTMKIQNLFLIALFTLLWSVQPFAQKKQTFFSYIYSIEGKPKITIETDVGFLIKKSRKEEYKTASFTLADASGTELYNLPGRVRSRGNMRKQQCRWPPVKFDFAAGMLDSLGFKKVDKIKFVFPCNQTWANQERLYKEFLLYDIYHLIDTNSIRTKLVDIDLVQDGEVKESFVGFIIEDEEEYAKRKDARVIESGSLRVASLDRVSFQKMAFFQYMIANTDWSIPNKHNVEIVKVPGIARVVAIPYDFDYAGVVGHAYAVPHESLPIKDVHQRYFTKCDIKEPEFYAMVEYYKGLKDPIFAVCDEATYMKEKSLGEFKAYIDDFFDLLKYPDRLKSKVVRGGM